MPLLTIMSEFPQQFLEDGENYKVAIYYRCPYIFDNGKIMKVDSENPLFWYMEDNKKAINEFIETIRMSLVSGTEGSFHNNENEVVLSNEFEIFTVNSKGIGHKVADENIRDFLFKRKMLFVDNNGVIYIFSGEKVIITLDLINVICVDSEIISKAIGKKVISLSSVHDGAITNEFELNVKVAGDKWVICKVSLKVNLKDFKNSKVVIEEKAN